MKNAMFDKEWFKLDNAAKIYPAARSSRWNAVFRMSAVMKEEVNPEILQQALDDVIDRFPTFRMTLKKGFFWYYFQFVEHKPKIQEETDFPCAMMRLTGRDYVFRVLYHSHRISVEVFHSITDGTGNITFLKTLVMRYCELCGAKIENVGDILHYDDDPTPEEVEDSFSRFIDKSKGTLPRKEPSAYQIKGQREKRGVLNVTQGRMPFEQLHSVAKSFGCTVNTYLTAVLAYALLKRQLYEKKAHKKPIRVQVPINLRKIFGSETLRNFAGYYNTNLSPEEMTFEEVVKELDSQLKEKITPDYCQKFINSNVSLEKNPIIKVAPRFLKTLFMNMSFYLVGENLMSCTFSNIGNVVTPKEMYDYIDRFEFVLGPQKYMNNSMTCASYNGVSVVTFSRTSKDPILERDFFKILTEHGIEVTVNNNRR
ncbi:MAG: hypothetical protein K2K85_00730 [Clostridia bacterium]|nr:hypothetical protein [Clostridia bacterium]